MTNLMAGLVLLPPVCRFGTTRSACRCTPPRCVCQLRLCAGTRFFGPGCALSCRGFAGPSGNQACGLWSLCHPPTTRHHPQSAGHVQELQGELDSAMDVDAGAGGELDTRVSLFDRCINAYGEARAAIKSALQLGASERGGAGQAGCATGLHAALATG